MRVCLCERECVLGRTGVTQHLRDTYQGHCDAPVGVKYVANHFICSYRKDHHHPLHVHIKSQLPSVVGRKYGV